MSLAASQNTEEMRPQRSNENVMVCISPEYGAKFINLCVCTEKEREHRLEQNSETQMVYDFKRELIIKFHIR